MDLISRHSELGTRKKPRSENREPSHELGTHGSLIQIPQPKPEDPQEGALPDPIVAEPEELNADISLSVFFSPQTGQIIFSELEFVEKTNSSNT